MTYSNNPYPVTTSGPNYPLLEHKAIKAMEARVRAHFSMPDDEAVDFIDYELYSEDVVDPEVAQYVKDCENAAKACEEAAKGTSEHKG